MGEKLHVECIALEDRILDLGWNLPEAEFRLLGTSLISSKFTIPRGTPVRGECMLDEVSEDRVQKIHGETDLSSVDTCVST